MFRGLKPTFLFLGLKVATDRNFNGRLCDIEPLFKEHLNQVSTHK
jgi:hypothetical protein